MDDDRSGSVFPWLGRHQLGGRNGGPRDELVATRDQMDRLVRAIVEIGSDLDLDATVHRIVKAAMELAGARYGALGIRGSDGTLVSFVQVGIETYTPRRFGHLAVGDGLRFDDVDAQPGGANTTDLPLRALLG